MTWGNSEVYDCSEGDAEQRLTVEAEGENDESKDGAADTTAPTDILVKCFTKCSFYSELRAMINTFLTSFLCACLSMSWCWAWQAQHQLIDNVV